MEDEESGISRRQFLTGALVGLAAAACEPLPQEPAPTSTKEPLPTKTLPPEPSPPPTRTTEPTPESTPAEVPVETIGFRGMGELTEAEQETIAALKEAYEEAVRSQELTGRVVLTKGDEEAKVGAFFADAEDNPWSLVTREEAQVLEQVPSHDGVVAEWKPNKMRFEYLVNEKTFIYEPENRILINNEGNVIARWNAETSSWEEVVPEPTSSPEPPAPVEMVAVENVDVYVSPRENRVGYFVPGQRFTPTGTVEDGWIQVIDSNNNTLWIQEGSAYEPYVKEAPCQVPHFAPRFPERKTGYIDFFGTYQQEIFPDNPYVMRWFRLGDSTFVYRRDARIVAIDRENSIVSFQLEGGAIIQRRFQENTIAIMIAHEFRSPMPTERAYQQGGNICDLEEGDFVSLIHPNEAEAANPNPNVIDLWGVMFVQ